MVVVVVDLAAEWICIKIVLLTGLPQIDQRSDLDVFLKINRLSFDDQINKGSLFIMFENTVISYSVLKKFYRK